MRRNRSVLVVVDAQSRLAPAMARGGGAVDRIVFLLAVARRLEVPIIVSEQYPAGLGRTLDAVAALVPDGATIEKIAFSCCGEPGFQARFAALGRDQVIICGMEAHVCVLQTAMDLRERVATFVAADAVDSRRDGDREAALARMARAGIDIVTSEMVAYEWLGRAGTDEFRALLELIK